MGNPFLAERGFAPKAFSSDSSATSGVTFDRLPQQLQFQLRSIFTPSPEPAHPLEPSNIYQGDARELLPRVHSNSVALSVWSPPYFVGKAYESHLTFREWQNLLREVIAQHWCILKPGAFLVVNIADILAFTAPEMPKVQAENISTRRSPVTRDDVLRAMAENPSANRYQIARILRCSEQTVDRRLNGNNIRGGKYVSQTKVKLVGGLVEEWGTAAGFHLYDRRVWVKDPCWANSKWASLSYRSIDESEYLYFFWKPGITKVDRSRLTPEEWRTWGSRGVWHFPSVRTNDDHEAKFPIELPRRVIKLLTDPGDLVLDCFMGSGTTAVAAVELNRMYLGIDIVPQYVELARHNVSRVLGLTHR